MARVGFVGVLSFVVLGLFLGKSESVIHSVGDSFGWGVPTNDDFYDIWEDGQIFRVGDQLSFSWTGTQNVVEVTEQQHDDCVKVTTNVMTTSPAVFNLTNVGNRYFITTIGDQCRRGQELEIEVVPNPSTPSPIPPQTPQTPSAGSPVPTQSTVHIVGDSMGWGLPTHSDFYDDWSDRQTFRVGDQLVFSWNGTQNVVEVTDEQHDDCIKVTSNVITTSPAVFNLTTTGKRYFITTIGNNCNIGQELEIEILPAVASPNPLPPVAMPPRSSGPPAPAVASTTHIVGDSMGWGVPTHSDFYDDWADRQIFRVGDKLSFNWNGTQNVVEVTENQHDDCVKVTRNVITTSPAVFELTTIGKRYFISTIGNNCNIGQELEIEVLPAASTNPNTPPVAMPPRSTRPPVPSATSTTHNVGDSTGWELPTHSDFYDDWADRQIFRVGDKLSFNWTGTQNVVEVTENQHDDCVKVTSNVMTTSPAVFELTTTGKRYFISTIGNNCNLGQELEIEVLAGPPSTPRALAPTTAHSPAPDSSSLAPSGSTLAPSGSALAPSESTLAPSDSTTTPTTTSGSSTTGPSAPAPSASTSFGPMVALSAALSIMVFAF